MRVWAVGLAICVKPDRRLGAKGRARPALLPPRRIVLVGGPPLDGALHEAARGPGARPAVTVPPATAVAARAVAAVSAFFSTSSACLPGRGLAMAIGSFLGGCCSSEANWTASGSGARLADLET